MDDKTLKRAAKLLRTLASATESLGKSQITLRDVEKEARKVANELENVEELLWTIDALQDTICGIDLKQGEKVNAHQEQDIRNAKSLIKKLEKELEDR